MGVKDFRETRVYKLAFEVAMEIFEISKTFPKEDFLLQIRSEEFREAFVLTLLKRTERNFIQHILFQKRLMRIPKIAKQEYG